MWKRLLVEGVEAAIEIARGIWGRARRPRDRRTTEIDREIDRAAKGRCTCGAPLGYNPECEACSKGPK